MLIGTPHMHTKTKCVTPQSSALGPLVHFSLYMLPLGKIVNFQLLAVCYDDDARLYVSVKPHESLLI